jgi:DNA helicase II / ATP-dependent DNA helicase PcrA
MKLIMDKTNSQKKLMERINSGYGLIILNTPNNPKFENHWTFNLQQDVDIKFLKKEKGINSKNFLINISKKIKNKESFILFSQYSRDELFKFEVNGNVNEENINKACFIDFFSYLCESNVYVIDWNEDKDKIEDSIRTPIEKILLNELIKNDFKFKEQIKFDPYVVDFLIYKDQKKLIVEADGFEYHSAEKDLKRDIAIKEKYGVETLRFGGSRIYRDAQSCVEEIQSYFENKIKKTKTFQYESKEKLDNSQIQAINHSGGPARVVAPAGSGKTLVLINHVVSLINSGIDPNGILCLAFNKDASEQMSERLNKIGVINKSPTVGEKGVTVATFNSFGYSLLRKKGIGNYIILDKENQEIANETINLLNLDLPNLRGVDHWSNLIKSFAKIQRGLISSKELKCSFENKKNAYIEYPVEPLFEKYKELCLKRNGITFDDQIYIALEILLSDSQLRKEIQRKITHLIVDEYQDLNPAQISLIRLLTANNFEIFVVGDDDQLIYSWRHVSEDNIVGFNDIFYGMKNYPLEVNYRSSKRVVKSSQRLISYNEKRVPKNIKPHGLNPVGELIPFGGESLYDQLDYIGNYIETTLKKTNNKFSSIAILTRKNVSQLLIARKLDSLGIPRSQIGKIRLYSLPVTQRLLAYLRCIYTTESIKGNNFEKIINRPNRFIPNRMVELLGKSQNVSEFYKEIINSFNDKKEYLKKYDNWVKKCKEINEKNSHNAEKIELPVEPPKPISYSLTEKFHDLEKEDDWHRKNLDKFFSTISSLNKNIKNKTPTEIIQNIINKADFREKNENDNLNDDVSDEYIVDLLKQESKDFNAIEDYINFIEEKTQIELGNVEDKQNKEAENKSKDCVRLSTVHSAKGREWETVILFDFTDHNNIAKGEDYLIKSLEDDEEERRVFYVALTRAKRNLVCTFRNNNPSKFLKEALISKRFLKTSNPLNEAEKYLNGKQSRQTILMNKIEDLDLKFTNITALKEELVEINKRLNNERLNRDIVRKKETVSPILSFFSSKMTVKEKHYEVDEISKEIDRLENIISEKQNRVDEISKINFVQEKSNIQSELQIINNDILDVGTDITNIKNLF